MIDSFQMSQYFGRPFQADPDMMDTEVANYQPYLSLHDNGHITSNPYEDHLQREALSPPDGLLATQHLRDAVYMSNQLANLTNTLKGNLNRSKKMVCQAGHATAGPCQQSRRQSIQEEPSHSEEDFVFRAVSPHGHVYWEIDPTRADKLKAEASPLHHHQQLQQHQQQQPTELCMSRGSSSRFSDNYPLIGSFSPARSELESTTTILVNPFADVQLISINGDSLTNSPATLRPFNDVRFSSLRGNPRQFRHLPPPYQQHQHLGTRASSARGNRMKDTAAEKLNGSENWRIGCGTLTGNGSLGSSDGPSLTSVGSATSSTGSAVGTTTSGSASPTEQIQQQAQIKDLRSIPGSVKTSEYILAKIQNQVGRSTPLNQTVGSILNRASPKQRKV